MELSGDTSAFARGGQFLDVALQGRFLRRPFAVQKWDGNSLVFLYRVVGEGTKQMTFIKEGDSLDLLTGLGNGFDASLCSRAALVVCGGLGASPVFPLVKELIEKGRKVYVVAGFNSASEIILEDEMKALGANVTIATMDGSAGIKGLVTDAIASLPELQRECDCLYTCGPRVMMKAVCGMLPQLPGEASLEERMGCGCGICYGCTCHTEKGPARVCADGPVFKVEDIIW